MASCPLLCARVSPPGNVPAIRQIRGEVVGRRAKRVIRTPVFFYQLAEGYRKATRRERPTRSQARISRPRRLRSLPVRICGTVRVPRKRTRYNTSTARDTVGREIYALTSRDFLPARSSFPGLRPPRVESRELAACMTAEQESPIAREIKPGPPYWEAIALSLDEDSGHQALQHRRLQKWMQRRQRATRAVERKLEGCFRYPGRGTASRVHDRTDPGGWHHHAPHRRLLSRAGRVSGWVLPKGVTEFDTWRELTAVYHEGSAGHHLQISQAVYNKGSALEHLASRSAPAPQVAAMGHSMPNASPRSSTRPITVDPANRLHGMLDSPADACGPRCAGRRCISKTLPDGSVHGPGTGLGANVNAWKQVRAIQGEPLPRLARPEHRR
jgi:hypothetical protein